ncbi:hypothetical protein N782_11635 [Pontibacillus yanchengensis Y32]|uniref:Uncharacterized protein n=1 Tax=Pontibacillus yanchengensis Y32 TaxID=1385514 RepID=A0A0A2T9S9_9BACI|nr:hypothetical protein N782_11635 [Pontibacillus yanchengensis Y32]
MMSPNNNTTNVKIITKTKGSGKYLCIIRFDALIAPFNNFLPPAKAFSKFLVMIKYVNELYGGLQINRLF